MGWIDTDLFVLIVISGALVAFVLSIIFGPDRTKPPGAPKPPVPPKGD